MTTTAQFFAREKTARACLLLLNQARFLQNLRRNMESGAEPDGTLFSEFMRANLEIWCDGEDLEQFALLLAEANQITITFDDLPEPLPQVVH